MRALSAIKSLHSADGLRTARTTADGMKDESARGLAITHDEMSEHAQYLLTLSELPPLTALRPSARKVEYQAHAEARDTLARKARSIEDREAILRIAETWRKLAR
jgi:hypothetical protein